MSRTNGAVRYPTEVPPKEMANTRLEVVAGMRNISHDEPLDLVLSIVKGFVLLVDQRSIVVRVYAPDRAILPGRHDAIVGRVLSDILPSGVSNEVMLCLRGAWEGSTSASLEIEIPTADGTSCLLDLRFRGCGEHVLVLACDVSPHKKMSRIIFEAVIEERRRIGADLHDSLAGQLYGASLMASAIENEMRRNVPVDAQQVRQVVDSISESIDLIRDVAHGLHQKAPAVVDLDASLQKIAGSLQRGGLLDCTYERIGERPLLHGGVAYHLEQVAHEAIRNTVKHSRATKIAIELKNDGSSLSLELRDNGIGISNSSAVDGGIGLRQMRYRAELIGASILVADAQAGGTLVRVVLHLENASEPVNF